MALGRSKVGQLQLHPARLDLREIEDVVDERQQVPPGRAACRFEVLDPASRVSSPNIRSTSTSREADDGVQRRAQLVRHVGEELALVPAGDFRAARLLSAISRKSRAFWMASADCVAKVCRSSMTSGANAPVVLRITVSPPSKLPSRTSGTARSARYPARTSAPRTRLSVGAPMMSGNLNRLQSSPPARPVAPSAFPDGCRQHRLQNLGLETLGGARARRSARLVVLVDHAGVGAR